MGDKSGLLDEMKDKHESDIKKLNDEYEQKLISLSMNDNKESDKSKSLLPNSSGIEEQVEANKSLRETVEKLLKTNNSDRSTAIEEKNQELMAAKEQITKLTEKLSRYQKKLREIKKNQNANIFAHASKCHYSQWFLILLILFTDTSKAYGMGEDIYDDRQAMENIDIAITQTLIHEDENIQKPFTIYAMQIEVDGDTWTTERRYKEFCSLHESLQKLFTNVKFPSSSSQFTHR